MFILPFLYKLFLYKPNDGGGEISFYRNIFHLLSKQRMIKLQCYCITTPNEIAE